MLIFPPIYTITLACTFSDIQLKSTSSTGAADVILSFNFSFSDPAALVLAIDLTVVDSPTFQFSKLILSVL